MKKFKANDNKSEEHEINYRQFYKKLELLNQILHCFNTPANIQMQTEYIFLN